jgi:hypothetical protein
VEAIFDEMQCPIMVLMFENRVVEALKSALSGQVNNYCVSGSLGNDFDADRSYQTIKPTTSVSEHLRSVTLAAIAGVIHSVM